jgi:hypothetical protein
LASEIISKKGSGRALEPGNHAVQRLIKSGAIQAKLKISQPNDSYEQEADSVAEEVMRMPEPREDLMRQPIEKEEPVQSKQFSEQITPITPLVQRQVEEEEDEEEEEEIQTKQLPSPTPDVAPNVENSINNIRGGGQLLPEPTRAFFEPRFRHDFSGVRIHTGVKAAELAQTVNARAFTVGHDLVFGTGQYAPWTAEGRRLLAHELTHVIQQTHNSVKCWSASPGISAVPSRTIQRYPSWVKKECSGAASKCSTAEGYCKQNYPTSKDIENRYKTTKKTANDYTKRFPHAADNLFHFLRGTGSEKVMAIDIFKNHKATKDKLQKEHRVKFINGAQKRLKKDVLKPGKSVDMEWSGTANAFSSLDDLAFAVGGYSLCSKVRVSVKDKAHGNFDLSFDKWSVQAFDCYNWDPGKGIGIPGLADNDQCCLQNAGKGKHFPIRTDPWDNAHAPSRAKKTISK